jgi:hypothetical protein
LRTQGNDGPVDSNHDVTRKVVVEHPVDSKISQSRLFPNARHLPQTLNSDFLGRMIRRRDQYLNSNVRSNWRTLAAENQRAIYCNVAGESALCVIRPVIPMEDDRESQSISHGISTLGE